MATSRTSPLRPSIRLSPVHSRENSRSTSPERHSASLYQKIDPLLSNLSPESTLHALTSTDAVPSNANFSHNVLSRSISQVSPAERAVGIRAAIAAQNLDIWYKEVQSWKWPKHDNSKLGIGFVPPTESSTHEDLPRSSSLLHPLVVDGQGKVGEAYYGSLPAAIVEEYEKRIEEIRDEMDNLNVEELKEHVLNAHIPSRSRPSSSTSTVSVPPPLTYVQLSDFTAVVTATILRALPLLSKLNSLLTTWDVRLLVLRQVPGLLRELKATRSSLDSLLRSLRTSNSNENTKTRLSDSQIRAQHVDLESAVVAVGRRMDRALDALEGREDSLPESWIDDLESIESDFAAWVVEAERYSLRTKWLHMRDRPKEPALIESSEAQHNRGAASASESVPPEFSAATTTESEVSSESDYLKHAIEKECEKGPPSHVLGVPEKQEVERELDPVIATPIETNPCLGIPANATELDPRLETPKATLADPATDTLPVMANKSPTQLPLPTTSKWEDKENVPPLNSHLKQPLSPPVSKPTTLSEMTVTVDYGPFCPEPSSSTDIPTMNDLTRPEGRQTSPGFEPLNGRARAGQDLTAGTPLTSKHQSAPPQGSAAKGTTEVSKTLNTNHAFDGNRVTEAHPIANATVQMPTIDIRPAEAQDPARGALSPFDRLVWKPAEQMEPVQLSMSESKSATAVLDSGKEQPTREPGSVRKPLQSPIKLSKLRPGKLNLDQDAQKPRVRQRQSSIGSVGSLLSSDSSLISSPDVPEPQTGSSHEGCVITPSRQDFLQSHSNHLHEDHHVLRADHLVRFENQKSSQPAFQQSRAVSLPLERFINDDFELAMREESVPEARVFASSLKPGFDGSSNTTKARSTPGPQIPSRGASNRPRLTRGKSASDLKEAESFKRNAEHNRKAFGMNTAHRAMLHLEQPKSVRLRQRLTAHPSLESLGLRKQELPYVEEDESELAGEGSRASTPHRRRPRDQLDEKINTILSTLPGRIHLVDPTNEADTLSSSSSMDRKMRQRCQSESPRGAPSRSTTPAPSLMLMPASRRRSSHAHKTEDSYVKLYHLHHGGQTAPTKLFVRTVGEDGQRVMVRVGGGWADLGEYLREYVIHHGRRQVSETPRVEVQGLGLRSSPAYASPATKLTPVAASPHIPSGRATPSRPASVMSARPSSSLTVRKRRGSNASDALMPRSVTTGTLSSYISPPQVSFTGRRLSMSSSYSFGSTLSPDNVAPAPLSHDSQGATPLGLAGPKPRSRQISMSPEGEAWVEDVLQQTRRSSSAHPPLIAAPRIESVLDLRAADSQDGHSRRSLPKVSSNSDIRSVGSSRRVSLRGLGNRR